MRLMSSVFKIGGKLVPVILPGFNDNGIFFAPVSANFSRFNSASCFVSAL